MAIMTMREVAERAGVTRAAVSYWVRTGKLLATKRGNALWFRGGDVRSFLARRARIAALRQAFVQTVD
jgi:AcrR family transcriptional regulator